jgi:hypothetical protein
MADKPVDANDRRRCELVSKPVHTWMLVAAGVLWLGATAVGFAFLVDYATEPGVPAAAPREWPRHSRIPAPHGQSVLVMTMHPHCPCTRASVAELNTLMARLRDHDVKAYVLAVKPADFPEEWLRTESYRSAERIPGVQVLVDDEGWESAHFGAHTSGQVLLYGGDGTLQFAGGITPDRGHQGDSPGRQRILAAARHGTPEKRESLVFGCPLGAAMCPLHRRSADATVN